MQALLSFENAPPFAAPLRFFITAPLLAALAGLILVWQGGDLLSSRWHPGLLAATHLLTVGFMLMVMLGALIQILPVVAGANLRQPLQLARGLHPLLLLGALMLAAGLLFGRPGWLQLAAALLLSAGGWFIHSAVQALWRVPLTSPTIAGLKLALPALALSLLLGGGLALTLAGGWAWPVSGVTDLHAGWALGAWATVLLAAVAYVVVPMFQLTPGYPARAGWLFPWAMCGVVLFWSLAEIFRFAAAGLLARQLAAGLGLAFAVQTLYLQGQRRRARPDAIYRFWQGGLLCAVFALLLLLTVNALPEAFAWAGWPVLIGVLLLPGAFVAFISGMLYKIVPFLAWMHLQNAGQGKVSAPSMGKLLPERDALLQSRLYFTAMLLLLLAVFFPDWLARPAGLSFAAAMLWLARNLWLALRRYRAHQRLLSGIAEEGA
ncbi:hypothetical protein VX159_06570 [Dechloromonas sp. ZY10]|uniref:hypothetical protein n=1 Tax=Dechloromonas aquae TaxID=2664436 RepID=UPI0035284E77